MPMAKGGTEHRSNITAQRYRTLLIRGWSQYQGPALLVLLAHATAVRRNRSLQRWWSSEPGGLCEGLLGDTYDGVEAKGESCLG